MKRRSIILFSLALVALVVGLAVLLHHSREPSYQGKSLTAWMDAYAQLSPQYVTSGTLELKITDAFKAMGTNCIPFIFQRLERQDSVVRSKYRDFWPRLPKALQKVLPAPNPVLIANAAERLIRSSGEVPFPYLLSKMKSRSSTSREVATYRVSFMLKLAPAQVDQVFPEMITLLRDPNKTTRLYSTAFFEKLGPQASNAVPALMVNLQDDNADLVPGSRIYVRAWTATALGKIGTPASPALPALSKLMNDSDPILRWKAAAAIWRITSNVETTLPVLTQELPASNEKWNVVTVLGEMGPRAKDAIPALEEELKKDRSSTSAQDANTGRNISNALLRIDPETAAKLGIK